MKRTVLMLFLVCGCGDRAPEPPLEATCGNGRLESGEACDDGNSVDTDACRNTCTVAQCGDGVVRLDLAEDGTGYEACDDGGVVEASNCLSDCRVRPCGTAFAYHALWLRGFRVCLAQELEEADGALADAVLTALDDDLEQIEGQLPVNALGFLKRVTIWLEHEQAFPGGVYHPSAGWLRNNGYPEAWAEGVMLGNANNYMTWVAQQPAMVLHELAHAWHHQKLGYDEPDIIAAYAAAMQAGLYDEVAYVDGGTAEAYAKTNRMEYFAELSEAWFWSNDFYPFNRQELLAHDVLGAQAIQAAWGVDD